MKNPLRDVLVILTGVLGIVLASMPASAQLYVFPDSSQQAAAAGNYKTYVPAPATLKRLADMGLPRFVKIEPSSLEYRLAIQRLLINASKRAEAQASGDLYDMDNLIPEEQQAAYVDMAFVLEGYKAKVHDGLERALDYGLRPLTLGQCVNLFLDPRHKFEEWMTTKTEVNGKKVKMVPYMQCAGTQSDSGMSQIYWRRKDDEWRVGGLGERHFSGNWAMSMFVGPTEAQAKEAMELARSRGEPVPN